MRQAFLKTKEELMLNYQKSMFSEDEERRPLLTEPELYDACLHAAATIITAYALGCEFEDCRLDDDGRRCRCRSRWSKSNIPPVGGGVTLLPPSR